MPRPKKNDNKTTSRSRKSTTGGAKKKITSKKDVEDLLATSDVDQKDDTNADQSNFAINDQEDDVLSDVLTDDEDDIVSFDDNDDIVLKEGEEINDDECPYNQDIVIDDNSDEDDEDDDDDNEYGQNMNLYEETSNNFVSPTEVVSNDILTKYEKVALLCRRTSQLAQGAKPMLKNVEGLEPRKVAQLELEKKVIPIKIIRPLPNGRKEVRTLSELRLKKEYYIYNPPEL